MSNTDWTQELGTLSSFESSFSDFIEQDGAPTASTGSAFQTHSTGLPFQADNEFGSAIRKAPKHAPSPSRSGIPRRSENMIPSHTASARQAPGTTYTNPFTPASTVPATPRPLNSQTSSGLRNHLQSQKRTVEQLTQNIGQLTREVADLHATLADHTNRFARLEAGTNTWVSRVDSKIKQWQSIGEQVQAHKDIIQKLQDEVLMTAEGNEDFMVDQSGS